MIRLSVMLLALSPLAACLDGYNPLVNDGADEAELDLPPGTENPTAARAIERYEEEDGDGNGYAQAISWDGTNFLVDNLAFDGENIYLRDDVVASLGSAEVYEGDVLYTDPISGVNVLQFEHKAVANESASGRTRYAIVRTGSYFPYGYGGFMYQRDDGVVMPDTGQAYFSGEYAGIRDFDGAGGVEYVTGDASAVIDFNDFNEGDAVRLLVLNRAFFDVAGTDITASIAAAFDDGLVPAILSEVGPGQINSDGEISLGVLTYTTNTATGVAEVNDEGTFWGLLSGEGADMELVGVVRMEGPDPRTDGVTTVRETGGIVAER